MDATRVKDLCQFTINGKLHTVDSSIPLDLSLNTYIREVCNLRGTKYMCQEGGCGACIVSLTSQNPTTAKNRTMAVNSCLLPVYSCIGKSITTVEGIGSRRSGLSQEQRNLADFSGSQCGYCSPGMVMNMYSLTADNKVTMSEVENSFGGNICRCTGYRPILDAFKALALDVSSELRRKCQDIEDICAVPCQKQCIWQPQKKNTLEINGSQATWNKPRTVGDIFKIFNNMPDGPYILLGGNTAHGVYRRMYNPRTYIDISDVDELHQYSIGCQLKLGANITLTDAVNIFYSVSKEHESQYGYLEELAKHIDLIANVPVRNTGTLAGNLSIKHQHREFPSDIFLMLETVGAKLEIGSSCNRVQTVELPEYLNMNMDRKLILNVNLPSLDPTYVVRTYKVMPRAQNSHAYVNAGFCFKLNRKKNGQVLEKPRIVFGGINPEFIHAVFTEEYLNGKELINQAVLKDALCILHSELKPDHVLPDASPEYRKGLAEALFYKFVLSLNPLGLCKSFVSGGQLLKRELSSGKQKYQTDSSEWPINKPVIKMEAHVQTSGEAEYVDDIPSMPGELFASFVLAKEGPGSIAEIDTSSALAMDGVVAFLGAEDIPGKNNFTKFTPVLYNMPNVEEIFSSGKILHAGQPVGIIVATSQRAARAAAEKVIVTVKDRERPVLTIQDAITSGNESRIIMEVKPTSNCSTAGTIDSVTGQCPGTGQELHVLKGRFHMDTQYHYTLETQTCLCVPLEDGMDVFSATQWMDLTNCAVAESLGIPENSINIKVRRMGGGFGGKISRSAQVACACALAAYRLNRPVRFVTSIEENMEAMGKRFPAAVEYEVQCNNEGKIISLKADLFQNSGCNYNETVLADFTKDSLQNGYDGSKWVISGTAVRTDIPSNTYVRAPGSFEAIVFIETIMEHIAHELELDSIRVRLNNIDPEETNMPKFIEELRSSSNFDNRKQDVDKFNKENRWKKRGISFASMKYPIIYFGGYYSLVSIYHVDGSVAVCHGGTECGQGINTKVAQVAAKFLNIDLDMVTVKPANNLTAPNSMVSGASITSEACAYATMICCQQLLKRLEPVRKRLGEPTWKELVGKGYEDGIDLCASYMSQASDAKPYAVEGAAVAEVEVDVLTGQIIVQRVDILENAGKSLSPELDIGQVEGAFIMGLGCLTSEEIIHDPETGRLLTNRTWNYKVPGVKDIPVEFNVELQGNNPNPAGVLRSKTTGEPALCLSCSVFFAIKNALLSARKDAGLNEKYFEMDAPATFEKIFLHSKSSYEQYAL
ncbi:uncharacterized protein [Anabrus simplex]|uniref:uncharacterized protein n=1 Tax=Anabrus simplex TaxID=316456 RepID=UPI0035A2B4D8